MGREGGFSAERMILYGEGGRVERPCVHICVRRWSFRHFAILKFMESPWEYIGIQVVDGMTVFNGNNMFSLQYMMCHSIFIRIMKSVRMYREGGRV